ncbi:tumor necrosis factor receptor [Lymphocystis disease virus 2]|uniref:Tumor necrosis factor receptor n=1 Tax=Lymphocystis disease virus 2 TaxID=159183 RepID=A0A6F8X1L0_9VIRU|nr:tumor necrosis factor receptor [Lymphocystis disease virus 2]
MIKIKILLLLYWFPVYQCLTYERAVVFPNGTKIILTCPACKSGEKLDSYCNITHTTACLTCPKNQYTPYDNYGPNCMSCTKCKHPKVELSPCTPATNRQCGCKNGYYENNNNCIKCSICYLGEGVEEPCSSNSNTKCKVCLHETFSNVISSEEPCKPYQNCTIGTKSLNFELSWYDKFCLNCTIFNATVNLNNFTQDFILYNYYTTDQLKKLARITFKKTRDEVEYMPRWNLESMFTYNDQLPNYMQEADLSGTADILIGYYNTIKEVCLSDFYYIEA